MKFADLHIHTNFSDSTYTPAEVVRLSVKAGLDCISITDHDTVEGIEPAWDEAVSNNLEIIPGIEMTTELDGQEVHILGYFIDYKNKELLEMLSQLKQIRIERIYKMVDKLNELGLKDISAKDVLDLVGSGSVGRMHLAMALEKKGHISSIPEAFYRFIGNNGPAYVSKFRFSPKEVIDAINKAGGISVIAHPHTLAREEIIYEFLDYGLKGIEVYYPEYTTSQTEYFINLAKKCGLAITGGSDAHGEVKENVPIGKIKIPYTLVEDLKRLR